MGLICCTSQPSAADHFDWRSRSTKSERFRYLGSILQNNRELYGDLSHKIQGGWMKWKSASDDDNKANDVLCTECWEVKKQHVQKNESSQNDNALLDVWAQEK
ncbi:hypothetical protein DVH24_032781 [Malus domestica]|uniref:Uncharacterized protein n=1 Tax=Malus domestica TaxID=3750 RepID=A0A498IR11_MALDO|nr:hypothetical protein DVH24_032781 [Malus domestica]